MSHIETAEKIKSILKENIEELETMEITDDLPLISGGFIDSFDVIKTLSVLEKAFDISIPLEDTEIQEFDTVNSIVGLVEKLALNNEEQILVSSAERT